MPAQRAKGTPIPDPFQLESVTLEWLQRRYPQVDAEIAVERFQAWASEYLYANWQRTFQNYLMREADNNKLGPMLKRVEVKTREQLLREKGQQVGFREPQKGETYAQYEAELNKHCSSRVIDFSAHTKAMR